MKYFIHLPMKMELTVSSETSAIRTQTPGNDPKRNILRLEHGESLKTSMKIFIAQFAADSCVSSRHSYYFEHCQTLMVL